jgi:TolB-like protein/Tfp pilus assembly protein PilF
MPKRPNKLNWLWQELKRRRVIHVVTVYASASFVLIELVGNLTGPLNLPEGLSTIVIIVLAVGFPLAVILSWIYDLTGEGWERTRPFEEEGEDVEAREAKVPNAWKIATYVSFVVIIALVTFNIIGGTKTLKAGDIQSLAILPFDNFTGDDQLDYIAAGMHASLIGDMGKVGSLRVTGKTSSSIYQGTNLSAPEIAKELKVDALVEPSVMCYGDSICVQIRVISHFPEEKQLWVGEYKEDKSQILNLWNQITKQIAEEVKTQLTPEEQRLLAKSVTVDHDAYDAYLRSYSYWDDLSSESIYKAIDYLKEGIEKDPNWAPLYAGLAHVYAALAQMGHESPEVVFPIVFENLNKAIELDPDFPDSHFNNAIIGTWVEWNWEKGEKEFLTALSLNPNDAMSRIYLGHLLMHLQRIDESVAQGKRAVELDPFNPLILALHGVVLSSAGNWKGAYEVTKKALEIEPNHFFAAGVMEFVAMKLGMTEEAIHAASTYLGFDSETEIALLEIGSNEGIIPAYEEIVSLSEAGVEAGGYMLPFDMATRLNIIGKEEKALEWLENGLEIHDPNMPYITSGFAMLENLYDEPRFIAILETMNLPFP